MIRVSGEGNLHQVQRLHRPARLHVLGRAAGQHVGTAGQLRELGVHVAGWNRIELGGRGEVEPAGIAFPD